ncbi:MAG: DUF1343 domain-containing protein [Bacteroidales bacterium]
MGRLVIFISIFLCLSGMNCGRNVEGESITTGAERMDQYLPLLEGRSVAVVANHTSLVKDKHLVDTLISHHIDIAKIFSPEHGFRGDKDAGEIIESSKDEKTGVPVISLYGSRRKPRVSELDDVDIVIFDIQDVGVRFYTYISTMHYVMEACAESDTEFLLLDRPNPNGFYVCGPVLDTQYRSFVGMHPVPLVHGMTLAELARMINGEGWLEDGRKCDLEWVPCTNYTHDSLYQLPVRPSPNLPNMQSVYLYPSLGLFEGTIVNVGRGTDFPFQVFGHPDLSGDITYTPESKKNASIEPRHEDLECQGIDLRDYPVDSLIAEPGIRLQWLYDAYDKLGKTEDFFLPFFINLSGNEDLKKEIIQGTRIPEVKEKWKNDLSYFLEKREEYLLYEDFDH